MSDVIYISDARLSFPNLVEPQRTTNIEGKERISYNCELILKPDHPAYAAFMKRYGELAMDKWKEHAQAVMQMVHKDRKLRCYGDGSEKVNQKTFQPYDGYPGHVFLSVGSNRAPQMIRADGKPVDPANTMEYQQLARFLYGGCRVNAAIKPWLQENKHGRGVRCDLVAIQFLRDDAPFGEGTPDVSGMFSGVSAPAGGATPSAAPIPGLPPFMTT